MQSDFYRSLNSDFISLRNIPNPDKKDDTDSDALKKRGLRHSYAITAHKAQGSEFENVFIDDSDLRRIDGNNDGLIYRKTLYTAATRAKRNAIIITNAERYDANNRKIIPANESTEIPDVMKREGVLDKLSKMDDRPSDKC